MKLEDFDFHLPEQLIAQHPIQNRSSSKLLVLEQNSPTSKTFDEIIDFFQAGDCLVLNDTKVIKSRIFPFGNDQKLEIFLHQQIEENLWQAFAKPGKKFKIGQIFNFDQHRLIVEDKLADGQLLIRTQLDNCHIHSFLDQYGTLPLPPYIKRSADILDEQRYQTTFAKNAGSVAAPTAGLHFTQELLGRIRQKGVSICYVTLHVGAGTFLPIKVSQIDEHKMHSENCFVPEETVSLINTSKLNGKKIIAVGTTTLRTLESCAQNNLLTPGWLSTDIFIKPGFKFQIADILVSNFHLPKSTLLILVSAFAGYQNIQQAYDFAIKNHFRFFSYGDACLLHRSE